MADIGPDLFGLSPLAVQARHDEAFDVEPVTREFFKEYARVFSEVEELIKGISDSERNRLFTQRLFNRLMFVAFIQKKGWLRLGDDRDYLTALWRDHARAENSRANFYSERLKLLFFAGLNTPNEINLIGINRGGLLKDLIGQVPYLNGGLFEEDEDDKNPKIAVPDEAIEAVLDDLFGRFNFTVSESTPLDIEVAVDPEMLGKIFEELVTGRHETGSYYTPKPVVSFMCREALKGYLKAQIATEASDAVEQFIDEHNPANIRDADAVLEALRRIKVCDPACGSGAYLLGMLHELLDLRSCLFATRKLDAISTYDRKLEIIQRNIYGVDLDTFAVNIARLRLWLSLAVDFEGENPPPLPNLDYKVEQGDSLTAPNPSGDLEQGFRKTLIADFLKTKSEYLMVHGSQKLELRTHIAKVRDTIASWAHGDGSVEGFDWPVEFAEVFVASGFDTILANPPYVRADAQFKHIEDESERQAAIVRWKEYRATLLDSHIYQTLYEKWDLYLPFLERGYQLLRPQGRMVFIVSDAYNTAKYAARSHSFFADNARIQRIDFCTEIPLFDAGISNTIVHFAKAKIDPTRHEPVRVRRWGESRDEFEQNVEPLPTSSQSKLGVSLFRPNAGRESTSFSDAVELGRICYISYGLRANSDDRFWPGEFTTDDCISEKKDGTHPKPFVQGKDLVKWVAQRVWYLEWGTKRAPKKFSRPTFPQLHSAKEKLIAVRTPGISPKTVYDDAGLHFDASSVGFVQWHYLSGVRNKSIKKTARYRDEVNQFLTGTLPREEAEELSRQFESKYLLAVMNSGFAKKWLAGGRRSKIHVYPDDWKKLPIVAIPAGHQRQIVSLVDAILSEFEDNGYPLPSAPAKRVADLELEIEKRVLALYRS